MPQERNLWIQKKYNTYIHTFGKLHIEKEVGNDIYVIYTAVDFMSQVRQCHGHCRNTHTHPHSQIFSIEFHLNQDDIEFCVKFVRLSMCEMLNNFSLFSVTF